MLQHIIYEGLKEDQQVNYNLYNETRLFFNHNIKSLIKEYGVPFEELKRELTTYNIKTDRRYFTSHIPKRQPSLLMIATFARLFRIPVWLIQHPDCMDIWRRDYKPLLEQESQYM